MLHSIVGLLLDKIKNYNLDLWKHSIFVMRFCNEFLEILRIPEYEKENIIIGSLLHDIGKISISNSILSKSGKLSLEEWDIMKKHPIYGKEILERNKVTKNLIPVVLFHHERWDGKGYYGIKENNIPIGARIVAIADAIEAMTAYRSYQEEKDVEYVYEELIYNQGKQFDPFLIECILNANYNKSKGNRSNLRGSLDNLICKCREFSD